MNYWNDWHCRPPLKQPPLINEGIAMQDLPELPPPTIEAFGLCAKPVGPPKYFTAEQMQAYARQAVLMERAKITTYAPTIEDGFNLVADAHMGVFGMKNSPARAGAWAALKVALEKNVAR